MSAIVYELAYELKLSLKAFLSKIITVHFCWTLLRKLRLTPISQGFLIYLERKRVSWKKATEHFMNLKQSNGFDLLMGGFISSASHEAHFNLVATLTVL